MTRLLPSDLAAGREYEVTARRGIWGMDAAGQGIHITWGTRLTYRQRVGGGFRFQIGRGPLIIGLNTAALAQIELI